VEIKKGMDCLNLECKYYIVHSSMFIDKLASFSSGFDEDLIIILGQDRLSSLQPVLDHQVICKTEPVSVKQEKEEECSIQSPPKKRQKRSKRVRKRPSILSLEFAELCNEVEIPDGQYQGAMKFKEKFQAALTFNYPNCELKVFRNWYLKLKSGANYDLLLYLDYNEDVEDFNGFRSIGSAKNEWQGEIKVRHFKNGCSDSIPVFKKKEEGLGTLFYNTTSGIHFNIVFNSPLHLLEVQTGRLLEHLLTFDARAKLLLTLVRYWAQVNNLSVSKQSEEVIPGFPPGPATLDWLVLLFLCKKGVVPTPRELNKRPHDVLLFDGVDIGFSTDLEHTQSFNSHQQVQEDGKIVDVLELAQEFFQFFPVQFSGRNLRHGAVLNTRDGKIESLRGIGINNEGLTQDDVTMMRSGVYHEDRLFPENKSQEKRVAMLNPLLVKYGFPICPGALVLNGPLWRAMNKTDERLKEILLPLKNNCATNVGFKSALSLG